MTPEQAPPPSPEEDPYKIAFTIGDLLLEYLQAQGEMARASEIENEWELEEHFDQLSRHYRWVCELLGLAWPPPARKLSEAVTAEEDLQQSGWV
jgi:hypothetical protein